jgi:hypothetical protein
VLERGSDGGEPRGGERCLDEWKELTLLESHMVCEARAKLVQDRKVRCVIDGKRVGARADSHVIAQRPRDERVVGIGVHGVRGKQNILLETENARGHADPSRP